MGNRGSNTDALIGFRWLGVAGIELKVNGQILAIDPFFTRPPFRRMWVGRVQANRQLVAEKIPRCDFVLVTHAHWDHLMDVPEVVRNTGAVALGSTNTCRLLAVCGVPDEKIREIKVGDRLTLGEFQVEVLPAVHGKTPGFSPGRLPPSLRTPLRLQDYRMDDCYSFLIQVGAHRLLDWCSEHLEPAVPAEVIFVGGYRAKAYYKLLLPLVKPRLLIPVHWDDLFRPLSKPIHPYFKPPALAIPPLERMNLTEFQQMIESIAPQTKVLVPEIFEVYDLTELI